MAIAFLSLGSNLGNRLSYIQQASTMIALNKNNKILKTSSFYETEPWGFKNQGWFLNAAVKIETNFEPVELLNFLHSIEKQLGRIRLKEERWHERTIDLDILTYDNQILNFENRLIIPHANMHKRAFVLVPLLEIAPDLIHPVFNKTVAELYDELNDPEDVFLYGTILRK